ncbi:hypothetical protein [Pantoea sp. 18069]|uniref:hypothetical protein n=1 Tax=Pantoea sp. 18069 TaxID=2681415 RepID=UPI001357F4E7|nr:hypothetical protein [Pantoea sp. 18069]
MNEDGLSALTYAATHQDSGAIDFLLKEKFQLSKSQVWEAIGISAKTNIAICLTLWAAIERNPENFIDTGEDLVIPAEVKIFKNSAAPTLERGVDYSLQDRNVSPALALATRPAQGDAAQGGQRAMAPMGRVNASHAVFDHSGMDKKRPLTPLAADERNEYEELSSSVRQRQKIVNESAADDDLHSMVQLSAGVIPSSANSPRAAHPDRNDMANNSMQDLQEPGKDRMA